MKPMILAFCFLTAVTAPAQNVQTWEQLWQQAVCSEDMDDDAWQADYERLQQLAEQPIDLNSATREQLEQLPFLSDQQVMDLVEYLDRYGPMRSMGELRMIRSMDFRQLQLMPFFTMVGQVADEEKHFPRWDAIARHGRHTLTGTALWPLYNRKGDDNGYLGYKYRHSLRYEFAYGHYVKAGLVGAQDAGEPFFANSNPWGYDTYSYYIQVRNLGPVDNAIVGKYKLSAGMGLVLNTSFSLGKLMALQNLGRTANTLRPHSSRTEADYFQGAAATVRLSKAMTVTAFASHRPIDATLNDDGTAATLITSGYHRTPQEMEKKHNTHLTAVGGSLCFRHNGMHLGANAVYTHLDRTLAPNTNVLYRRHYAQGNRFFNASMDYGIVRHRFSINGETAANRDGAIATVNAIGWQPSGQLSAIVVQRFYSYRYTGLYAHGFGENSRTQNESGVYVGLSCKPLGHLHLQGYADYAYFPWARYQAAQSSRSWDFLLQADYQLHRWALQARGRVRLRQKDNADKSALTADNGQRMRLAANYDSRNGWAAKTQADFVQTAYKERQRGWMLSQQFTMQHDKWTATAAAGYFDTDGYDSRIYVYERQLQHEFSFPNYYGTGIRLAFFARADLLPSLRLTARLGYTNYFDRPAIGSGLQQIAQSHMTDLNLQLRWKF